MKNLLLTIWFVLLLPVSVLAQNTEDKEGWLGVYTKNLSEPMRQALNVEYGVLVSAVVDDSPADKGGIEMGDVILKLAGEKVTDREVLIDLVRHRPQQKVDIELLRKGKKKQISLTLAERTVFKLDKKKVGKFRQQINKYLKEIEPLWQKGTTKYQTEMERLKQELKELRQQLKEMREELEKKLKEKNK